MKIVVTGAAGAIGSHLCERLLNLKHEVVGIDALTDYYNPEIKKINIKDIEEVGGKVYVLDLVSDDIASVLDGVHYIFHLAAQPGISTATPFEVYLRNNVVATYKILEYLKKIPTLKGFIHASTSSIYGAYANGPEESEPKPTSHYGVTKLAAEQLAMSYFRESGLPVSVLRFFSVYGERERPEKLYHKLIRAIYNNEDFTIYEGARDHIRSYTYISDIIDGCILVMENFEKAKGEIFNLGNDQTMTTGEGIDIIQNLIGKSARFVNLPKRVGDQKETAANIDKMRKLFGYSPKVKLEDGLARQVDWYKNKIYGKII
jgi:nucleoside-diphosphate-sugar epimerase